MKRRAQNMRRNTPPEEPRSAATAPRPGQGKVQVGTCVVDDGREGSQGILGTDETNRQSAWARGKGVQIYDLHKLVYRLVLVVNV